VILTGEKRRIQRETCLNATLSATNPTCIDLGANQGQRGESPATIRLSHGMAFDSTPFLHFSAILWFTKNLKRFNKIPHMYNYSSEPHSRLSNFVTVFLEAGVKLINKRTGKKVVAWTKYSSDASIEY
jgi:hypothetical protein